MQPAIESMIQLGPLPASSDASAPDLQAFEAQFAQVQTPITDDEARALVRLFGPDDCFGLAWSLVHLIETAPGWPLEDCFDGPPNRWIDLLRESARRALGSSN
jgi:hypothetical protein